MDQESLDLQMQQISDCIENKNFKQVKVLINELLPQDTAILLEELPDKLLPIVFRMLSKENAAETFVEMSSDSQELLLTKFTDDEVKNVFDEIFIDDAVDVIEEMPASIVKKIINQADAQTRKIINEILQYPDDSAGTLMTVEYVSLKKSWTVRECFDRIRREAVDKETIYNCYVTDQQRRLIGCITVKTLLLNSYETVVGDIMETDVISVETTTDKEEVASLIAKYDLSAMPVVDKENRIVGIITVDDVLDVMEDEATEDISKMAAITPSDEPYLDQSIWQIWKNRVPWLLLLMISATFTGLIITHYESTLSVILFACVPMLMDTGGNAGSQASVTIIRSLAVDEVEPSDVWRVLWKELRVALILALTVSAVCFGKLMLIDRVLFGNPDYTWQIATVVSLALFATITIAKVVGCLMPILAKTLKLDPAVVASPFITTIVDVVSLIVFCTIAQNVLPIL